MQIFRRTLPLLERHVVENDVGHRSREAVHIPKPDGKGSVVVKLGTACNVTGDGAIALIIDKIMGKNRAE